MSSPEFRIGRTVKRVIWPDDSTMAPEEDSNIVNMMVALEAGNGGMEPWIRVLFVDGDIFMINPRHAAMIIMD